jgi:hypothetical protein
MEIATEKVRERPSVGMEIAGPSERSFVEALLDPVSVFEHPMQVAEHPWFTDEEKRTILLSWARDELVAEQVSSRLAPELRIRSRIDAVVEALSQFDEAAADEYQSACSAIRARRPKRLPRRRSH